MKSSLFDKDGNECKTELSKRLISIDFEQFKKIKCIISVAAGLEKAHTILNAAKGNLIDVLILDEELAYELLRILEEEQDRLFLFNSSKL